MAKTEVLYSTMAAKSSVSFSLFLPQYVIPILRSFLQNSVHTVLLVVLLTDRHTFSNSKKNLFLEVVCEEVRNTARFECFRWAPWRRLNSPCETFLHLKNVYQYTIISLSLKTVFCDVTSCNLINRHELAEEPSACNFRRWKQNVLPNRSYVLPDCAAWHGLVFTFTALRTYISHF
jgi:hypothetical protein